MVSGKEAALKQLGLHLRAFDLWFQVKSNTGLWRWGEAEPRGYAPAGAWARVSSLLWVWRSLVLQFSLIVRLIKFIKSLYIRVLSLKMNHLVRAGGGK